MTHHEVEEAWQKFCREHLAPSILFSIAVGFRTPTKSDRLHLEKCEKCRDILEAYLKTSP